MRRQLQQLGEPVWVVVSHVGRRLRRGTRYIGLLRRRIEMRGGTPIRPHPFEFIFQGIEMTDTLKPGARGVKLVANGDLSSLSLYDRAGDKLGAIKDVYIDKITGQIEFVVGATGGFLGVGEKFHPLPWRELTYRAEPEGYMASFTKRELADAPSYDKEQLSSAHYGWGDAVQRYFASLPRSA